MFNEEEIISRCLKNERKAQKILYEKYSPVLLGIAVRFAGNRAEAEDILQEAFVKIFLNLNTYRGSSSLTAWMGKIVTNTAITLYHRNKKHNKHFDLAEMSDKINVGCDISELEFTKEEMLSAITDLSPGYRMVFNLYALEGYKHKEIAEQLNIDVNTSKSQYSRAKKIIQCRLLIKKKEVLAKEPEFG